MHYRYKDTVYHVWFVQGGEGAVGVTTAGSEGAAGMSITLDGVVQAGDRIPLTDDRVEHKVEVRIYG